MKRFFTLIIAILIFSLTLCVPAFAAGRKVITLSEDYKEMYFNGDTYTRVDASMLTYTSSDSDIDYNYDTYEDDIYTYDVKNGYNNYASVYKTKLTKTQYKEVKTVDVIDINHDETIFLIMISFYDGSDLSIDFIREDLVEEYYRVINGETKEYYVDFRWPEGNIFTADKEKFFIGKKTSVDYWENTLDISVYADSTTGSFDAEIGVILKFEEKFCFYNFADSDIKSTEDFWLYDDLELDVIELTDEELLTQLKEAEQKYLDDNYGYLFNEEFTEPVAKIFFTLVFAIFPLAIAVVTFILTTKSKKGLYKKLLFTTSALSLASLATFIYIAFTLFNK